MVSSAKVREMLPPRVAHLVEELFRDNAMMDEATRYMRQFMRTGGDTGKGANLVILGIIALFYVWFLATMIRLDLSVTIPLEYAQLVAMTLIAPTSIYAAISGEREKATWDALVLTRLTPAQIIIGKLAWRILILAAIMGVLLFAVVISQFMGNPNASYDKPPTWPAVFVAQVAIFAWAVFLTTFSLWVSSRTKQGVTTIALVISTLLGALIMLPILCAMFGAGMRLEDSDTLIQLTGYLVLWSNPFLFLASLTGRSAGSSYEAPPLDPLAWALLMAFLFMLATAILLYDAHASIRRLEEPVKKA